MFKPILVAASLALVSAIGSAQQMPGIVAADFRVFAPAPDGGIQAIDLEKGTVLWQSRNGDWPIGYGDGKLVAISQPSQSNDLSVSFLEPSNGRVIAQVGPVQLVPWAKAHLQIAEMPSTDFSIWIASSSGQGMVLKWRAERWSPITLGNYRQPQTLQSAAGWIHIEFAPNSVQARPMPPSEHAPNAQPPNKSLPMLPGAKGAFKHVRRKLRIGAR